MVLKQWILKVGNLTSRSEGEKAEGSPRRVRIKQRLALVAATLMLFSFVGLFTFQTHEWNAAKLEVAIPWSDWHTLFQADASWNAKLNRPQTQMILASETTKANLDHIFRVKNRGKDAFWIAAEIKPEILKAAADSGANVLSLGYFSSDYRLWMDDELILTGTEKVSQSIFLPVSIDRLQSGKPLQIVFEMKNIAGWNYPDMLELFFKSPGFLTAESATLHEKQMDFLTATRPSIFFTLNLVMAIGFLFFWLAAPKRQEYFIIFLYCFVLSALQAHLTNLGQTVFTPTGGYRFDIFAFCMEAAFSLAIALAFARVKRIYIETVLYTFTVAALIAICVVNDSGDLLRLSSAIQLYLAPPLLILGALVCYFKTAYLMMSAHITEETRQRRTSRLIFFGTGLLVIAVIHIIQSSYHASESFRFWCVAHFGMVVFLALLKASDYHETEALIKRVPYSIYHRPDKLGVPVSGAIVTLDLKRSETLMLEGARLGDSSMFITETVTLIRHTLSSFGGTMILTDGDSVKCFFEEEERFATEKAVLALTHAQDELKKLSASMQTEFQLADNYEICFRAGIAFGTIRPTVSILNGKDHPEWEQVGQSQVFLESARLMEAESSLQLTKDSCILISKGLPFGKDGWMSQPVQAKSKHGQTIDAVALRPTPVLRAVA